MPEPAAVADPPKTPAKKPRAPKPPTLWTAKYQPSQRTTLKHDAYNLERLIMCMANHPLIDPVSLASLVRSWCQLVDCIRVIQGKPLPGQLRPDLDPNQMVKAMKRIRERLPVDIAGHKSALADGPAPASAPPTARRSKRPPSPDATSSLTEQQPNPLTKPPIEERLMNESALDLPDDETTTD